ncbi:DNA primase small subunit PriS [Candidatus Hecatella orcuttiae]|uniref:DNA primase small subunit PriS n=1 Tax=Candidatus Hecatella orcuttiae TaxID=1935119 RepID=UPI002867E0F2|nr:DNA primase small subunit PriS [Candidatus Hecatella orcuttiae]
MVRHRRFESRHQLVDFLINLTPSDVYYSSAYYEKPDEEKMKEKGWLGADLVFDIDCDDLRTPCKKTHDAWKCLDCGKTDVGFEPEHCPRCESRRIDVDRWVCDLCLEAAKQECLKLLSFLEEDFGFPSQSISIAFSGHRGYHIHVEEDTVKKLGSEERKEIIDYVTATGLKLQYPEKNRMPKPLLSEKGWEGRLARTLYTMFQKRESQLLENGLRKSIVAIISEQRDKLLEWLHSETETEPLPLKKKVWEELLAKAVDDATAAVDTVVTTDIHRLIRMPTTLHGKTGLKVAEVDANSLPSFKPLTDSLVLKGENVKIKILHSKPLTLGEKVYQLPAGESVKLPLAEAVFLVGTGKAVLA